MLWSSDLGMSDKSKKCFILVFHILFQKKENQLIASVRIVVEHAIGGVKRCRIVKEIIRIYNADIRDRVIETCAALHNYRLAKRGGYKKHELFNPPVNINFCE